jgi:hypothetical protein
MWNWQSGRRAGSLAAVSVASLILLLSQPGCDQPAPATEPEKRIEAQKKRAETLKGEIGYAPPAKSHGNLRRR